MWQIEGPDSSECRPRVGQMKGSDWSADGPVVRLHMEDSADWSAGESIVRQTESSDLSAIGSIVRQMEGSDWSGSVL